MKHLKRFRLALFLAAAFFLPVAAQSDNRIRVIGNTTPTPTPPIAPAPTASPTPVVSKTPLPATPDGQTIFDLQAKIRQSLLKPDLRRGSVGVKIVSLDTGKVVFEQDAEKYFMPASNMKSFTVAAALEKLSPNFRFVTSVYAVAPADASGTIKGDLTVFGRGDVSFSTAFYEKDYFKGLDALVDRIAAAGVKRIEGNLVGDESYFSGSVLPPGWEWDDLQWYYGAEVSALPLNDNAVDLSVKPSSNGAPCIVNLLPFNSVIRIVNTCKTTAAGVKRDLTVKKDLDQNVLEISGTMPVGDRGFADSVTVSHPAELFISLLRQRLAEKGITVAGQTRIIGTKEKANLAAVTMPAQIEIARLESPPFSLVAAKTMKPSQNMYTETILWTLGEQGRSFSSADEAKGNPFLDPKSTSADRGIYVVRNFLNEVGVAPDALVQYDGSGLSRHNLVTPASLVQLYTYMAKQSRYASVWYDALPVGGVDGTLRSRFADARTNGNVHAKTGTIDQVSALSGYVTTAAGEKMVFSIIVNGVREGRTRTTTIDEIVKAVANFDGRTN